MHPVMRRLVRDHGAMQAVLDAVEREVAVAEAGGPLDSELVVLALRYLRDFPEWHHHPLEEALFARAIGRDPGCEDAFAEVWAEHDRFPAASQRLLDWFEDGPEAPAMTAAAALDELGRYAADQRRHIRRENDEVFLVLLSVLTDEDWAVDLTASADGAFQPLFDRIQAAGAGAGR